MVADEPTPRVLERCPPSPPFLPTTVDWRMHQSTEYITVSAHVSVTCVAVYPIIPADANCV